MLGLAIAAALIGAVAGIGIGWGCGRVDGIHEGRARQQREHRQEGRGQELSPTRPDTVLVGSPARSGGVSRVGHRER